MPSLRISTKLPGCGRSGHRAAGCDGAQEDGAQGGQGMGGRARVDGAQVDRRRLHRCLGSLSHRRRPSVHAASAGAERLPSPTHTSLRPFSLAGHPVTHPFPSGSSSL